MTAILSGLRIVEASSFIASPSCGLHLRQLGAEVIRIDAIGGGPDFRRWPQAPNGASLYWEGLNKGKKSVAVDLSHPEGRELMAALATAPGANAGLLVTNYPVEGFLSYERLKARREDIVVLRVMGWADGTTAVDYTVNAAVGIPLMTGPESLGDAPVNHSLPAWDLLAGAYGAFALLAAERFRRETGIGQEVRLPLGDLAWATLGHLGQIAEVSGAGTDRPRHGNDLYGAFGRDFATADGRRLMLVAITRRQWSGLVAALEIGPAVAALEAELGISFAADEGLRFLHRERLFPLVEAAVAARSAAALAPVLDRNQVCWSPYRSVSEAVAAGDRFGLPPGLAGAAPQPSGLAYPVPGAAAGFGAAAEPLSAPRLGEHTDAVLAEVLGLPGHEIGRLHDAGLVAG